MTDRPADPDASWGARPERQLATVARNVSTRYVAIMVETVIGLVMLPFNLFHLGAAEYGLWILIGSLTLHFSILDLGYGGGLVKFIAHYRARRDSRAINEIASTLFFVMAGFGLLAYALATGLAFNLGTIFPRLSPEQLEIGKWLLLITALHVAMTFPFGIFGAVTVGFQRHDANNFVAIMTSVVTALVNVTVLLLGYGLLALVACTTLVRLAALLAYRRTAYRIYPALSVRPSRVRRTRLREITGFSIYAGVIDWANKLNYQIDDLVIGAFLGSAAVAVWAVAGRIIMGTQRLTNQLNGVLFPLIVDSDSTQNQARLRQIMLQGTRLSLATVIPIATVLIVLGDPLIRSWTNAEMAAAVPILQVLAIAVVIRVGNATGNTLLKGAGEHKLVAWTNLAAGFANLALSIYLVRHYGLMGVAVGTLVPIALCAALILNPAACRRVGLPIGHQVLHSVVPTVWPAFVMGALLTYTAGVMNGTLLAVALQAALGSLVYYAVFFGFAVGRADRAMYTAKALELLGRPGHGRVAPPVTVAAQRADSAAP
ncbi:oligosaccharide flippase family protein [soil metagenome]